MTELPESTDLDRAIIGLTRMARMLERTVPGMTLADFRILSAVQEGEARASRLAHRLAVGKPSMSSAVDSLLRRGLLSRSAHATDQRAFELALTEPGHEALGQARSALGGLVATVAARTADAGAVVAALAALDAAIEDEIAAHAHRRLGDAGVRRSTRPSAHGGCP